MICAKCKEEKGDDFRKRRPICRECDNAAAREYRKTLKDRQKPDHIICKVCNEKKTEFRINRKKCLDCERDHGKQYRKDTDKAKIWASDNKERMAELQRNWRREKYNSDPKFKLAANHRSAFSSLITGVRKSSKHINCSTTQLKKWLKYQFIDDMSFDNYCTEWVIDHVIPVDYFLSGKHSSDIVLNWLNVQPMCPKKNGTKHKNIDKRQCIIHLHNIKQYIQKKGNEKISKPKEYEEYVKILEEICNS